MGRDELLDHALRPPGNRGGALLATPGIGTVRPSERDQVLHPPILEAIQAGDVEAATRLLEIHVLDSGEHCARCRERQGIQLSEPSPGLHGDSELRRAPPVPVLFLAQEQAWTISQGRQVVLSRALPGSPRQAPARTNASSKALVSVIQELVRSKLHRGRFFCACATRRTEVRIESPSAERRPACSRYAVEMRLRPVRIARRPLVVERRAQLCNVMMTATSCPSRYMLRLRVHVLGRSSTGSLAYSVTQEVEVVDRASRAWGAPHRQGVLVVPGDFPVAVPFVGESGKLRHAYSTSSVMRRKRCMTPSVTEVPDPRIIGDPASASKLARM